MSLEDYKGRTVSAILGAGVGASVVSLSGGCPANVKQQGLQAVQTPPAQVIRQDADDKKQLTALLEKITAYNRYDERGYTEVWQMHRDAGSDRQHRGFVNSAQKVGEVVGKASDIIRRSKGNTADMSGLYRDFRAAASEAMDLHFSGRDPLQLALSEVPAKYWPEDRLQGAVAQYDAFLADVKAASELVKKLGLDTEKKPELVSAGGR